MQNPRKKSIPEHKNEHRAREEHAYERVRTAAAAAGTEVALAQQDYSSSAWLGDHRDRHHQNRQQSQF